MKKAKLMLTGLAIFGLVGGAFAYKATTTRTLFIGTFNGNPTGACQTSVSGRNFAATGSVKVYASTTSLASGCPSTFTTTLEH